LLILAGLWATSRNLEGRKSANLADRTVPKEA